MEIRLDADAESSVSGIVAEQMKFDMSKQAKLFHMLSSSLYSNKPASIIRELCSNAHDSHNMAGCIDKPFELIAPSYETPELVVKDFGVGLTSAEAKETILCYLGSIKDTSNDFIGGWGIGAKSPFSYAKNYTIIVIKGGVRAEFLCWKDEHGLPCNALVREEATGDRNGVEVRVPVEATDIRKFTSAVSEYMLWSNYNLTAHISNYGTKLIERRVPVDTLPVGGANMMLFENGHGSIRLVYGGFSYEMSSCIDKRFDQHPLWEKMVESMSKNYDIALVVDRPGIIDFNMNREELEQTPRTQKFIMDIVAYLTGQALSLTNAFDERMKQLEKDAAAALRDNELLAAALETDAGAVKPVVKNLAMMSVFVDDALNAATNEDRIFAKAFRVFEHTFAYEFKGEARKINAGGGVSRLYSIKFRVAPITDQLVIAYCRILNPTRPQRQTIRDFERGSDSMLFFVKAITEQEAKAAISTHLDFAGMDLNKFTFVEINVPLPPKSTGPRSFTRSPPRIYDAQTKKYIKYNENTIFVMKDGESDPVKIATSRFAVTDRTIAVFTPTVDFVKRYRGAIPNVHTEEEFIEQFFEKGEAKAIKWGGITGEMVGEANDLAYRIDCFNDGTAPPKLRDKAREIVHLINGMVCSACDAINSRASIGDVDIGLQYDTSHWVEYMAEALTSAKEFEELERRMKFVNIQQILRNRTDSVVVSLIDTLKIQEWV
jgi:hypothetical protein